MEMSSKHGKQLALVPQLRPGEGSLIEISRQDVTEPDGNTSFTFKVNIGEAPVPNRRFYADSAAVMFDNGQLRIVLGQRKLVGRSLKSAVVVFMSGQAAQQFMKTCETFYPEIQEYAKKHDINEGLTELTEEPEHTTSVTANIIVAGFTGREGCLDLYNASPFVIATLRRGGRKMAVDPIVRVDLSTGLMLAILDKLDSLKDQFPSF